MDKTNFYPREVIIKTGDIVVFENTSDSNHWPASNIHPTHKVYPEFDPQKPISFGQSWEFKFEKAGEWLYHDHLSPNMTGKITVAGDNKSPQKPTLPNIFTSLKLKMAQLYYQFNPSAMEKKLNQVNLVTSVNDEDQIAYLLQIAGVEKVFSKLLSDSDNGSKVDCHQQAHKIGRVAYKIYDANSFKNMDSSCHSGFIHGAMESFLQDKGTQNLSLNIQNLCNNFSSSFGTFECLHGVGHGVMAYENYDLASALKLCQTLTDSYSEESCYGGVFMENIIASQGNGVTSAHRTQWVSQDPLFPCNSIDQEESLQMQCYLMQTSRMLDLFNYDFYKVSQACTKAQQNMVSTCFQSLGRDAAGYTLRDSVKTNQICKIVPKEHYQDCVRGALFVLIDFWGDKIVDQPHTLCKTLDSDNKAFCYQSLGSRLPGIFGTGKINQICSLSEENYQKDCLQGAGIF